MKFSLKILTVGVVGQADDVDAVEVFADQRFHDFLNVIANRRGAGVDRAAVI